MDRVINTRRTCFSEVPQSWPRSTQNPTKNEEIKWSIYCNKDTFSCRKKDAREDFFPQQSTFELDFISKMLFMAIKLGALNPQFNKN